MACPKKPTPISGAEKSLRSPTGWGKHLLLKQAKSRASRPRGFAGEMVQLSLVEASGLSPIIPKGTQR